VLDDPAAELDSAGRSQLWETIRRLGDQSGPAIILSQAQLSDGGPPASTRVVNVGDTQLQELERKTRTKPDLALEVLGPIRTFSAPSRGVDLELDPPLVIASGELVALSGPNGSGKSSLLHGLVRAIPTNLPPGPPIEDIGYVVQQLEANFVGVTVQNELASYGIREVRSEEPDDVLTRHVSSVMERSLDRLSTLDRRLVAIFGMSRGRRLLLLDEPDVHLSSRERDVLIEALCGLTSGGCAVLVATHSDALLAACDRITRLNPSWITL
jgi:ABC-type multidrug transport system ATPase subunit